VTEDAYAVALRRELVRAQARLSRTEKELDALREENRRLKERLDQATAPATKRPAARVRS